MAVSDQVPCGLALGMQSIRGDHHTGQVDSGEQWRQFGDLVGLGRDLTLGQYHAAVVADRGGRRWTCDPGNGLYATHDGGASWHRVALGPTGSVITALGTGGGMVYASLSRCPPQGGNQCSQTTVIYAASVGSDRWSAVSPTLPGGGRHGLVVQGADWYLPLPGGIYHGHGNAAPTQLPNPCPQYPSNPETPAVAVADPEHLDAMCASEGAAGSAQYQLFGTTDGGQHWTKAGPTHMEASGLYGLADNARGVLLVATASGGSEILRSTDDGTTLANAAIKTASGGIGWNDLGFTTPTQAIAILQHTALYLSHDSGHSWTPVHF